MHIDGTVGGLRLEEASIGQIHSMAGILVAVCQYVLSATIVVYKESLCWTLYRSIELGRVSLWIGTNTCSDPSGTLDGKAPVAGGGG